MSSPATIVGQFSLRSLRHSLRDAEALLIAVLLPVMIMLLFTLIFGGAIDTGTGTDRAAYLGYIVPGVILLSAGFGSAGVAVDVATDMRNGIVDRLRTMPVPAYGVVVGHVTASVLRNLLATSLVVLVGILLGFRPAAGLGGWVAALGLIAAFVLAMTWLFAAVGLAAGSANAANGYGFVLLFLPYLSSAFVPVATLPSWLAPVAQHQPMTPIIDSVRAFLAESDPGVTAWLALLWCAVLLAVAVAWSAWAFGRRAGRR